MWSSTSHFAPPSSIKALRSTIAQIACHFCFLCYFLLHKFVNLQNSFWCFVHKIRLKPSSYITFWKDRIGSWFMCNTGHPAFQTERLVTWVSFRDTYDFTHAKLFLDFGYYIYSTRDSVFYWLVLDNDLVIVDISYLFIFRTPVVGMKVYAQKRHETWYKGTLTDIAEQDKEVSNRLLRLAGCKYSSSSWAGFNNDLQKIVITIILHAYSVIDMLT